MMRRHSKFVRIRGRKPGQHGSSREVHVTQGSLETQSPKMREAAASIEKSIPAIIALIAPDGWASPDGAPSFDEAVAAGQMLMDFRCKMLAAAEANGLPIPADVVELGEHMLIVAEVMLGHVDALMSALLERTTASVQ